MTQPVPSLATVKFQINIIGESGAATLHTNVAAVYAGQGTIYMDLGMVHAPDLQAAATARANEDEPVRVDVPALVRLAMPHDAAQQFLTALTLQLQALGGGAGQGTGE